VLGWRCTGDPGRVGRIHAQVGELRPAVGRQCAPRPTPHPAPPRPILPWGGVLRLTLSVGARLLFLRGVRSITEGGFHGVSALKSASLRCCSADSYRRRRRQIYKPGKSGRPADAVDHLQVCVAGRVSATVCRDGFLWRSGRSVTTLPISLSRSLSPPLPSLSLPPLNITRSVSLALLNCRRSGSQFGHAARAVAEGVPGAGAGGGRSRTPSRARSPSFSSPASSPPPPPPLSPRRPRRALPLRRPPTPLSRLPPATSSFRARRRHRPGRLDRRARRAPMPRTSSSSSPAPRARPARQVGLLLVA
jgi:hypothetical protein